MSRVSRAEKMLNNLAASPMCELSKDGANYVKQRFDPYHDLPMKPVGYPDGYAGSTVARCIKKTMTISATSGGDDPPATTWNCHIWDSPIEKPVVLTPNVNPGRWNVFVDSGLTPASQPYGGLMAARSDTETWNYPSNTFVGQLNLSDNDLKNVMRIISSGWEVIDQTAELYKQGTLTAYRQNQQQNTPQTYMKYLTGVAGTSDTDQTFGVVSAQVMKFPPVNTASAMLIPNTKQWLVKEGAYVVTDYNSDEIPMVEPQYIEPSLLFDSSEVNVSTDIHDSANFMPRVNNALGAGQSWQPPGVTSRFYERFSPALPNRFTPKNQSGVFLTGLNPQASITVNKIWYVECAPTGEDEELLSLCSQSPEDDPIALKIVAALRRDSPVAVKLYENYMGEWFFSGIKDLINKTMPWLSNAQVVGNQVVKWIDTASTNDGYINPQSFVKGPVAPKIAKEKKAKAAKALVLKGKAGSIPKAPGPAPMKVAFSNKQTVRTPKRTMVTPGQLKAIGKSNNKGLSSGQQARLRQLNLQRREIDEFFRTMNANGTSQRKKKAAFRRNQKNTL